MNASHEFERLAGAPDDGAIERFLSHEATLREEAGMYWWAGRGPDGVPVAEVVRAIIRGEWERPLDARQMQHALHIRLQMHLPARIAPASAPRGRVVARSGRASHVRYWMWGVTAGLTLLGIAVGQSWFASSQSQGVSGYVVTTIPGQRARIQLPDGSQVLVGPASTLRYSTAFGKQERRVELEGQALFTVTHADGVPFVVQTGVASARVLGTSFTVRQYAEDSVASVVVAEGRIAVDAHTAGQPVVVATGELARITSSGQIRHDHVHDLGAELGWTQGRLVYKRARLADVLADVSRTYGIQIQASVSLRNQRFTGVIDHVTGRDVIAMLAATFGVIVKEQGTTFFLNEEP